MMLLLQSAQADLYHSSSRRVDAELCLIRLCDRRLSDTPEGILARLSRLEAQAAQGFPATPSPAPAVPPAGESAPPPEEPQPEPEDADEEEPPFVFAEEEDAPPWDVEPPPPPVQAAPPQPEPPVAPPPAPATTEPAVPADGAPTWAGFLAALKGLPPMVDSFLRNPASVTGVFAENTLTLWTDSDLTKSFLSRGNTPALLEQAAEAYTGQKRTGGFPGGQAAPGGPAFPWQGRQLR